MLKYGVDKMYSLDMEEMRLVIGESWRLFMKGGTWAAGVWIDWREKEENSEWKSFTNLSGFHVDGGAKF